MNKPTHLSLFTGIGGLDIAAEWAGFETVGQCEWADYPRKVLTKHWPDVPKWRDIRTLTGDDFYERTGMRTVDIISGGFPCQPFSIAGKRRGKDDDRYLWPEMLRVISEVKPTWIIGENVAGIVSMALDTVCAEMESEGYEVQPFLIPACSVQAPHRRERVFIVGHAKHNGQPTEPELRSNETAGNYRGSQEQDATGKSTRADRPTDGTSLHRCENGSEQNVADPNDTGNRTPEYGTDGNWSTDFKRRSEQPQSRSCGFGEDVADTNCTPQFDVCGSKLQAASQSEPCNDCVNVSDTNSKGLEGQRGEFEPIPRRKAKPTTSDCGKTPNIENWKFEPDVGRVADGVPNRVDRLKSLGNAVVPQQAYPLFKAIAEILQTKKVKL
jgi:DNA (cytosine-5)-methyltransferase 1